MDRIYLTLARQSPDKAESLAYLHKAFDVSKEGEDKLQQAGIAYELGRDYEAANDSETAIKVQFVDSFFASRDKVSFVFPRRCLANPCHTGLLVLLTKYCPIKV